MIHSAARPLLHSAHTVTFVALFATGLLLYVPSLRAMVTGGYSLLIRQAHRWCGVAFAVLPVLIVVRFGARSVFVRRSERTLRALWQRTHVAITVAIGAVFTVTGFVLWNKRLAPRSLVDVSFSAHDWLTYVAAFLVAVHLLDVGITALVARLRFVATTTVQRSGT